MFEQGVLNEDENGSLLRVGKLMNAIMDMCCGNNYVWRNSDNYCELFCKQCGLGSAVNGTWLALIRSSMSVPYLPLYNKLYYLVAQRQVLRLLILNLLALMFTVTLGMF